MKFVYSDGGRSAYFRASSVGDCVCRAICNATGMDYKRVYSELSELCKKRGRSAGSPRDGVAKEITRAYMERIGWTWHATMAIGSGCRVHLDSDELPPGSLVVRVSGHVTCVRDGVLYDTYDCTRGGDRCVYGYWSKDCC